MNRKLAKEAEGMMRQALMLLDEAQMEGYGPAYLQQAIDVLCRDLSGDTKNEILSNVVRIMASKDEIPE